MTKWGRVSSLHEFRCAIALAMYARGRFPQGDGWIWDRRTSLLTWTGFIPKDLRVCLREFEARKSSMHPSVLIVSMALIVVASSAPVPAQQPEVPIWPGKAPGSETWTHNEIDFTLTLENKADSGKTTWRMVRNVATPTLTVFAPERSQANGTGIIICPGGGFRFLSWESEGTKVAEWLAARGFTAFVLKYRLVPMPAQQGEFDRMMKDWLAKKYQQHSSGQGTKSIRDDEERKVVPLAIDDGRQSVRWVRARATEWHVLPDRIGIMGFSAGGAVTMGVALDHDANSRPNFAAPIYAGSVDEHAIPTDAPPLFLLVAQDDVLARHITLERYSLWRDSGHSVELHVFARGGHGFGMIKQNMPVDHWIDLLGDWLDWQGLMKPVAIHQASGPAAY
jgi:acetyl esterase/lipase